MPLRSERRFISKSNIQSGMLLEFSYTKKSDGFTKSYMVLVIDPAKKNENTKTTQLHGVLINDLSDDELIELVDTLGQRATDAKVKLYTDPSYFGSVIKDKVFDSLPIINISASQLVGFEPDDKIQQPESKANVANIVAGLKRGDKLPPILVRKYENGYQVLDGHHRFWAYKLLKVTSIPSRIVPNEDIEEVDNLRDERAKPLVNLQSDETYDKYVESIKSDRRYRTFVIDNIDNPRQILLGKIK
jgi:hypothetical protein